MQTWTSELLLYLCAFSQTLTLGLDRDVLSQNSFAFAAANGLLRKVVPAIDRYDAVILDLTEVLPLITECRHQRLAARRRCTSHKLCSGTNIHWKPALAMFCSGEFSGRHRSASH